MFEDRSGFEALCGEPLGADDPPYDETADETAFRLAAIAIRDLDSLDAHLRNVVNAALAGEPASPTVIVLALTARRLSVYVKLLAARSDHPFADSLRRHEDLAGVQGEQLAAGAERFLAEEQDAAEARTRIRAALDGEAAP